MKTHLISPLLGVGQDTHVAETLPTGTVLEYIHGVGNGFVNVSWHGRHFSVLRDDLLDACCVADAVEIGLVQEWMR